MSHHTPITAIARIALLAGVLLAILLLPTRAYQPAHAQDAVNETFYYAENRTDEVVSYSADDPEGVNIEWTASDADNGELDFSITNGELKFTTQPDYEAPKGGQNNNSNTYRVALTASDGAGDGNTNPSWTVTVIVTDVEEAGTVSLSGLRPLERKSFTATLDDPDGGSGDSIPLTITTDNDLTADATTKWQWARSTSKTGPWTDIKDATGSGNNGKSYTPTKDDLGHYLRATATYTDRRGENKTASAVSAYAVQKNLVNDAPEFQDSEGNAITATTRSVAENSPAGTLVGAAVTAHDDEDDVLTYALSDDPTVEPNNDDDHFDFNTQTGQISVKAGKDLDYEVDNTYSVRVTATDPSGTSTTATVTINVTDVSEAPKFTEEANTNAISISKPEDTAITEVLSTYKATDDEDRKNPDGTDRSYSLYWSLSGDDKDQFQLCPNADDNTNCEDPSNNNTARTVYLKFKASPNYEAAADSDKNNKYQVTVEAYDSIGKKASLDVTVTVTNKDEGGTVTLSGSSSGLQPRLQPQADTTIYAHLSDPDGVKSGTLKWQWKTSGDHDGSGGIPTEGIVKSTKPSTSNSYKPTADDVGKFLWAIATYTDNQGANKETTSKQPTGANVTTDNYTVKVKNQYCSATSTAGTVNNQKQYRCSSVKDGNKAPTFPNTHATTRSLTEGTLSINPTTAVTATDAANISCDVSQNFYDAGCLNLTSARDTFDNGTNLLATTTDGTTDRLTYSLEGNDASKFDIDNWSGQLSLDTPLDFENPTDSGKDNTYNVTVKATDPSGKSDTIAITIEVTNKADEAPKITGGATAISTPEGTLTTKVLSTYTATDDEDDNDDDANSIVSWALSGADDDDFQLCDSDGGNCHDTSNTGGTVQLRFKKSPDYEAADDTGANNVYQVTLTATDSDDNAGTVRNVTVRVTNVDETEAVTLSANQPKEGVPLTATLADVPDLVTENTVTWQWARSTSQSGPWIDIANANATQHVNNRTSTYTATTTDMGSYLRATAAYTDGHGPGKTSSAVSVHPVAVKLYLNKAPVFNAPVSTDGDGNVTTSRSVPENSSAGTAVGAAVAATDIGRNGRQEVLTYELSDGSTDDNVDDDGHFDFNTQTGQISVKAGKELDTEAKSTYNVVVKAIDPSSASSTIGVTINVTNVEEAPEITEGAAATSTPEKTLTTTVLSTYKATDDEDDDTTLRYWSLSGPDSGEFQLCPNVGDTSNCGNLSNNTVHLKFKASPDYEKPTDKGGTAGDNKYHVTVTAYDSIGMTASQNVIVTVTNVDEPGVVTLSGSSSTLQPRLQPQADTTIYARLSDPDGVKGSVTWHWATSTGASNDGKTPSDMGKLIKSNSYKPSADDVNDSTNTHFLWAIATYTDGEGRGKKATSTQPTGDVTTVNYKVKVKNQYCSATTTAGTDDNNNQQYRCSRVMDGNVAPKFSAAHVTRSIQENAPGNIPGGPVTATDSANTSCDVNQGFYNFGCLNLTSARSTYPNGADLLATNITTNTIVTDQLTYSLGGDDASKFELVNYWSGQLKVKAALDYENPTDKDKDNIYAVTVRATDPSGKSDTIDVSITVTKKNEAPTVSKESLTITGPPTHDFPEDRTNLVLGTYTAAGPAGTTPRWSTLSGDDAGDFSISSAGALSFRSQPNFEVPADADTDNVYEVTLQASVTSDGETLTDDLDVTVTVTNAEEAGTVTLSPTTRPRVGTEITAALTDPDSVTSANTTGSITTGVTWQWAKRATTTNSAYVNISGAGARSASYTPTNDDADYYLRATASYAAGQSAVATTTQTVLALTATPNDGTVSLSTAQPRVGSAVTASLSDQDGPPSGLSWQWSWATTATAATSLWTNISDATSASYTPVTADVGRYLRATASYSDAVDGDGQTAFGTSANAVTTVVAVDEYDRNADGRIDSTEVLEAVSHYFAGTLSQARVLQVVALYFAGLPPTS